MILWIVLNTLRCYDLGGSSVVIIGASTDGNKSSIYLDADHDGIADNSRALMIAGQSSYNLSGYILTTTVPAFKRPVEKYDTVYYKVDAEYPAYCFADGDAKLTIGSAATRGVLKSEVADDSASYVKGGCSFYVEIQGETIEGMAIDSVVFGSADTAMTTSNNKLWSGG